MFQARSLLAVWILAFFLMLCGCGEKPSQQTTRSAPQASPTSTAASPDVKRASTDTESQLRDLLIERKQVLEMLVRTAEGRIKTGVATYDEVFVLRRDLLAAELDLCNTPAERIAVCEKTVQLAKKQEQLARDFVAVGKLAKGGAAKARLSRLEAEIELLREKLAAESKRGK